ncbi:hypothetical protein MRB53_003876 [Persea americana]|uniref:Uncharacterized protein n=1 Tax=Persea americana TaxID=3435 RepID=A0ACC2MZA9_PERAE|nr:hypothetical protein MRB53_003876 [Persea americana]|eukprot:TRINITY_DN2024_c0_g1_i1.p1 TRINITY_DN2024_c0_g1~~TRINITY_DN2024_c0_g1_i1.p1  ORF type:complete len:222 (-),score=37.95 TRINITY_DN2024_c0_g1_i1:282-947(-)
MASTPLPVSSTNQGTTTTQPAPGSSQNTPPIATPAFRAFISRISDSVRGALSHRRPWGELVDRSAFSRPDSVSEATARLRKNYSYFRVNYVLLIGSVLALSLLSNPFSLLLLVLLSAAWLFLYLLRPSDPPLILFGRTFSDRETLGGLIALSIVVVFLTSVGSIIISSLMLGLLLVAGHGSFRVPEDLFLDEQEPTPAAGLLSFLGGAASSASAPAVAARV